MNPNTNFTEQKNETGIAKVETPVNLVTIPPMELVKLPVDKAPGWVKLGDSFYAAEEELLTMANEAISELSLPLNIEQVPEAEAQLKKITSIAVDITEKRKKITSRLDDLSSRLMKPEKSLIEPKQNLTDSIIKIKKAHEIEVLRVVKKTEEIKKLNENMIKYIAEQEEKIKLYITSLISKAYTFALDRRITPSEIGDYIKVCVNGGTSKHFSNKETAGGIKNILSWKMEQYVHFAVNISEQEAKEIVSKYSVDLNSYANSFEFEMNKKFSDYTVAFVNIKEALIKDGNDRAEKEKQIANEKLNTQIGAAIQASAITIEATISPATKALKKIYKIDMPDTFESMITIFGAFLANKEECLKKTVAKKWFSFTASSAALCLEKIKNDNAAFQPSGIKFIEVDKL